MTRESNPRNPKRRVLLAWPPQSRRTDIAELLRSIGDEVAIHDLGSMAAYAMRPGGPDASTDTAIVYIGKPPWLGLSVVESVRHSAPSVSILAVVESDQDWVEAEALASGADRVVGAHFIRLILRGAIDATRAAHAKEGGASCPAP